MRAQQTKARMAESGCRRPNRLRGSGTLARKESRLSPRDASMPCLRATVQRESGLPAPQELLLFSQAETVNGPDHSRAALEKAAAIRIMIIFSTRSRMRRLGENA